ncbi:MAG: glycosyltransferase 61 family protein [Bacteroidota bacterium]
MIKKGDFLSLLGEMTYGDASVYKFDYEEKLTKISIFKEPWKHGALYLESDLSEEAEISHSFVSDSKKFVFFDKISVYHLFIEIVPSIIDVLINYPDTEIILHLGQSQALGQPQISIFLKNFCGFLNSKYNNRITIMHKSKDIDISINNYIIIDACFYLPSAESINKARSLILEYVGVTKDPFRKVYLSRKKTGFHPYNKDLAISSFSTNQRILDEEKLELFLAKNGFEIVVPENFDSFVDQLRLLSQTTILISATSSGLGGMIAMMPGTSVVEIVTTIDFIHDEDDKRYLRQMFHNQYGPTCFTLGLNNARIPNVDRKAETIIETIKASKSLQGFLQIDKVVE